MYRGSKTRMIRMVHVRITGTVQGVGYRAFVERMASRLGLDGWVRNRRDGSVEALFCGESQTVEAMLAACRNGPRLAVVDKVAVAEGEAVGSDRGFRVLPTE
jgi:acylphosphatase